MTTQIDDDVIHQIVDEQINLHINGSKYSKDDIQTMLNYCHNNGLVNNFIESLNKQFNVSKSLSERQADCLNSTVSRHRAIGRLFNYLIAEKGTDWYMKNLFIRSIHEQFKEKNYLTDKQLTALKKNCNEE